MITNTYLIDKQDTRIISGLDEVYQFADKLCLKYISLCVIFGIAVAPIYDTWLIALGIGGLNMVLFILAYRLPKRSAIKRHIISAILALLMLQLIAEMHGMAELHFIYFINIAFLIVYQDWRVMIPFAVITIGHHCIFFYLQLQGAENLGIYFINYTQVNYTVLFFHFGLATFQAVVCGFLAYLLYERNIANITEQIRKDEALLIINKGVAFAQEISKGDLSIAYQVQGEEDSLGQALTQMQKNLLEAQDRKKREAYEILGLNQFTKVLQENLTNNLNVLCDKALKEMISHLDSAYQAALFITNEEKTILKMMTCYAYSRLKTVKEEIPVGQFAQDLLVQAFLDKKILYLKEIPADYTQINSVLGNTIPHSLLIVPIQVLNNTIGVMEIAFLEKLPDYKIAYIEKVGKSLAGTISYMINNEKTQNLLQQSQEQTEKLQTQEEELRQNMEELETNQELLSEQQSILTAQLNAIDNSTISKIELNVQGIIENVNATFCKTFHYESEEIIGKHHRILLDQEMVNSEDYVHFWNELKEGQTLYGEYKRINKNGETVWLNASYSPVINKEGQIERIIKLAVDITQSKKLLQQSQEQTEKLQTQEEELRQNMEELETSQELLRQQKQTIEASFYQLNIQNTKVNDSIRYAQRIQNAILPHEDSLIHAFAEYFVIFKPKDVVSGDFYWYLEIENKKFIAVVDCTGHGVPGAFMSMIGNTLLYEIINAKRIFEPQLILDQLHLGILNALNRKDAKIQDGMDVALCCIEEIENQQVKVQFSGAKRPLYYFSKQELIEVQANKKSIGQAQNVEKNYDLHEFILDKGDILYMTTDGWVDAINSERKRFGSKQFREMLLKGANLPLKAQEEVFRHILEDYEQGAEQRDDVLLVGVKI